jgi:hypothetical protein
MGGYFGLHASAKHDDARSDCNPDESQCGVRGLADYREAIDAAKVATISITLGAVLVVGGAVLYWIAPRRSASSVAAVPTSGSMTRLGATF